MTTDREQRHPCNRSAIVLHTAATHCNRARRAYWRRSKLGLHQFFQMGNAPVRFDGECKMFRRRVEPMSNGGRAGKAVETIVQLHRIKLPRVKSQPRVRRQVRGIKIPGPMTVMPSGSADMPLHCHVYSIRFLEYTQRSCRFCRCAFQRPLNSACTPCALTCARISCACSFARLNFTIIR